MKTFVLLTYLYCSQFNGQSLDVCTRDEVYVRISDLKSLEKSLGRRKVCDYAAGRHSDKPVLRGCTVQRACWVTFYDKTRLIEGTCESIIKKVQP